MTQSREPVSAQSVDQIADLVVRALRELASRPDPRAFEALLQVSEETGHCLGLSARTLAESGSWSQVADVAGTTKQAAWSRWRQP
jgi:hypothetical protein